MIKKIILSAIILASIAACDEDILNVDNPNVPTQKSFWNDVTDAQKGLTAA